MPVIKGQEWTFNTQAELYEKMRPGYPKELYDDIFRLIPIDPNSTVVEIGIGGGQATKPFLDTGCRLTAIEYGDRLIMMYEGRVAVDVSGEEKKLLKVEDLMQMFEKAAGASIVNDRLLLG